MKCRSCGSNIQSGVKQCPHCGAEVSSVNSRTKEEFQWNVDYFPQPRQKKDISVDWNTGTIVDGESNSRYRHSNIEDNSINNSRTDLNTEAENIGGNNPEPKGKRLIRSEIDDLNEFGWESDRKTRNEATGLDRIRRSVRRTDEFGWDSDSASNKASERTERIRKANRNADEFGWERETENKKTEREIQRKNSTRENNAYNESDREREPERKKAKRRTEESRPLRADADEFGWEKVPERKKAKRRTEEDRPVKVDTGEFGWEKTPEKKKTKRRTEEDEPLRIDTDEFGWEKASEKKKTKRRMEEDEPVKVDTDEFGWEKAPERKQAKRRTEEDEPLRVDTDEFGWEKAPERKQAKRRTEEDEPLRVDTDEFGWEKVPETKRTERRSEEKESVKIDTDEFGWAADLAEKSRQYNTDNYNQEDKTDLSEEFDWEMQQDERRDTIKFNSYLLDRNTGSLSETRELRELLVFNKQNEDFQQVLDQQMDSISSEIPETDVTAPRGFDLPSSMDMSVFDSLIDEGSVHTGDELIDQADAMAENIPDTSSAVKNLHKAGIVGRETMVRLDSLIGSGDGYDELYSENTDQYPHEESNAPRTVHAEIADYPDNTFEDDIYVDEEADEAPLQESEYDDLYERPESDYQEETLSAYDFDEKQAEIADTPDRTASFDEGDEYGQQYYYEDPEDTLESDVDLENESDEYGPQYYYEESEDTLESADDLEDKNDDPEHEEYVFEKIQKLVDAEKKFKEDMERVSYLSPEEAEQIEQIENKRDKLTFVPTISYSTLEDEYEAYKSGSEPDKKKKRGVNIKINEPSGTKVTVKTQEINLANKSEDSFNTREVRLENLKKPPKNVQVSVEVNSLMSNASVEVTRHHDGATVVKTIDNGSSHEEVFPENIIDEEAAVNEEAIDEAVIDEEFITGEEVIDEEPDDDEVEAHMVKDLTDDQAWDRPVSVPKMTITDIFGPGARKFIGSKGHNKDEDDDDDDDLTDSMILDIKPEDIAITREQTQSIRMPSGLTRKHKREELPEEEYTDDEPEIEDQDKNGEIEYAENYIKEYEPEVLEAEETEYVSKEPEQEFEDGSEYDVAIEEDDREPEYDEWDEGSDDEDIPYDEDEYDEDVQSEIPEYRQANQDDIREKSGYEEKLYPEKPLKYPKGWTGAPIMRIGKVEDPRETELRRKRQERERALKTEEPEYEESVQDDPIYEAVDEEADKYRDEVSRREYEYREAEADGDIKTERPEIREYGKADLEEEPKYNKAVHYKEIDEYEEAEFRDSRVRERKPERRAVPPEKPEYEKEVRREKPRRKEPVNDEESYEYRAGGLSEAPVMRRSRTEYEHTRTKIEKPERSKAVKGESAEQNEIDRRKEAGLREIDHREKLKNREAERNSEAELRKEVQNKETEDHRAAQKESIERQNKIRQQVYQPDMRVTGVLGKKPTIRLDRSPTIRLDDPENKEIMQKKARIIKIPEIAGEDIDYSSEKKDDQHKEDTELKKETRKERRRARRSRDTEELEDLSIDRRKVASAANGFQDITNMTGNPKKKKFGRVTKAIIAVLIVLIIAEFSIIGIRLLAPDSGAAVFIERVSEHIPFLNSESEEVQYTVKTEYQNLDISDIIH